MMAMLLSALDQTIVATAMPTIGRELGDAQDLPWIVTAYLLSSTAATPLAGKLSDIHGRQIILTGAIAVFLLGSIACALAPSLLILSLARGLQGIGGGSLISLAQTVIADIVTPRERARYQVYIATVFMGASLSGPVLGGYIAQHLHWSLIFWINLPFGLIALAMTDRFLKRLPRHERKHQLDLPGAALLVVATTTLLLALSACDQRGFNTVTLIGLIAVSAAAWGLLVWRLRTATEPLIPVSILSNKIVRQATLAASLSMGFYVSLSVYIPLYFQELLGLTASQSGLALLPLAGGVVIGSTISGRLMVILVHYKKVPLIGLSIAFTTMLVLILVPYGLSQTALAVLFGVMSAGIGTVLTICTVSLQNTVPYHQLGTATASMNLCRQLTAALFVAVFGAIIIGGSNSAGAQAKVLNIAELQHLIFAYRIVFGITAIGIIIAFFSMLYMEEKPLLGSKAITDETTPID
jgi:EmrB/QacA subfamily drug resistance transporter